MGLGLQPRGSFTPHCKYDARAGRWFKKGDQGDVDITNGFAALFDFEEIQIGWMLFPAGAAPVFCTQHISMGLPQQPADKEFKQGFRMIIGLPSQLGGGAFELSSTAGALIGEIDKLHTDYMAAPQAQQGLLPVVAMNGTTVVETKSKNGTTRNYAPNLAIVGWAERPATMPKAPRVAAVQPPARSAPQPPAQPGMFQQGGQQQPQQAGFQPQNSFQPQQQPQGGFQQQPAAFSQNTAQDSRQAGQQGFQAPPPPQGGQGAAPSTGSERVGPPAGGFSQPPQNGGSGLGFG